MKLTLIQPAVGHLPDRPYLRSWQMEPLGLAQLAALTPQEVSIRFFDDRLEPISFDEPTDLVAMTVETYTARRAYQIADEYRRRGVPVVLGGFHPTLCPDEATRYADSILVGEAEDLWAELIDDVRARALRPRYRTRGRVRLAGISPDRSLYRGKRYLPIGLAEASRGCCHACEFCAVGACYRGTQSWRPVGEVVADVVAAARHRKLVFLVDDNLGADLERAKELFRALAGTGVRWVSQCSLLAARDEEFLHRMVRAGCQGVLLGFESLDPVNLTAMKKSFNGGPEEYERALENLARHRIRIYGTFVFGYDGDTPESFRPAVELARRHRFYVAAFNHLVPFPGTPLYRRLQQEGRLLYERWWLDDRYRFNDIAFRPARMEPAELRQGCLAARRSFYSWPSILARSAGRANRSGLMMFANYFLMNGLHRGEVDRRDHYPLGDAAWNGQFNRQARSTVASG